MSELNIIFNEETEKALDTLWTVERKLLDDLDCDTKNKIYGVCTLGGIIRFYSPAEVIHKYCNWENKLKQEFHIGDQVKGKESSNLSWVTYVGETTIATLDDYGRTGVLGKEEVYKTGKINKTLAELLCNRMSSCDICDEE